MRERITIGEVAKLIGVTTKTVRHYHKIGLLPEPERSESGYRLYGAKELLRLQRIRRLRSFGLSLKQINKVLGSPANDSSLKEVLYALHSEVSAEIERLEERRRRLESLLAREEAYILSEPSDEPYAIKLAEEHLGEHLSGISAKLWQQERQMWSSLDAFDWPEGYKELQELITLYYADRPDEYRQMLAISERLAALAELPEDDPEVGRLAKDLARHLEQTPFPDAPLEGSPLASGPMGKVFADVLQANLSPPQKCVIELVHKYFEEENEP